MHTPSINFCKEVFMRSLLAKSLLVLSVVAATAAHADPRHVRMWRGFKIADMSEKSFIDGLNQKLFPATGELFQNGAGLEVYVPATLNHGATQAGLPEEVALLSYQNEETYKAFRATPAGKHYGELHWDLFVKDTSKSLVAEEYSGSLAVEHAYVSGALTPVRGGENVFMVQYKDITESEEQWLSHLNDSLARNANGNGFAVLVAHDYALLYLFGRKAGGEPAGSLLQESMIKIDREVKGVGESIYYQPRAK